MKLFKNIVNQEYFLLTWLSGPPIDCGDCVISVEDSTLTRDKVKL